jgi:hypothetical protein
MTYSIFLPQRPQMFGLVVYPRRLACRSWLLVVDSAFRYTRSWGASISHGMAAGWRDGALLVYVVAEQRTSGPVSQPTRRGGLL